jgi:multiple antibiotic resistance protein
MDSLSLWFSTFGLLFAVIDPFGYIPMFLAMTTRDSDARRKKMLRKACIASFIVLAIFTLVGQPILNFFSISIPALQISGGIILLTIGFNMLNVTRNNEKLSVQEEDEATQKDDISIVPLAIPMLAGPASITTVLILSAKSHTALNYFFIFSSIILTLLATYIALRFADKILSLFGVSGLNVITRIMGLLLSAMAVQLAIDGYHAVK